MVIPTKLRQQLLAELHSTREGVCKMTANAIFWWPLLDREIEQMVVECRICSLTRPEPKKAVLMPGVKSNYFYEQVYADFLGPIRSKMILIIIDAFLSGLKYF